MMLDPATPGLLLRVGEQSQSPARRQSGMEAGMGTSGRDGCRKQAGGRGAGRDAGMDVGSRNVGRDPCGELGRAGSQKAGQFSGAAFQTWLFLLFFSC